jgi:Domain of unknown function (DUF4390)
MVALTMTVFITHFWKSARRDWAAALACAFFCLFALSPVRAQTVFADIEQFRAERAEDGVYVSANIRFELPSVVEDALLKGIPMFFVAEAEIVKDRWYWYDKRVALTARHMRLAYQPLTRRWRLNVAPGVISNSGLGVTLSQNYDTLSEAMTAIRRLSRWRIADASDVDTDGKYSVDLKFRLDISQLPRPFQLGTVGQSDWNISAARSLRIVAEAGR